MDYKTVFTIENVLLSRRGQYITGTLILSQFHMIFMFHPGAKPSGPPKEIWICYPIIERLHKSRGASWGAQTVANAVEWPAVPQPSISGFDEYSASHIRVSCKDFTNYMFDFPNDLVCTDVFNKISGLVMLPKSKGSKRELYAFEYKPNPLESRLSTSGWFQYDALAEFKRQKLIPADASDSADSSNSANTSDSAITSNTSNSADSADSTTSLPWRLSNLNKDYRFCPSYPRSFIVPNTISDSVLEHARKFRSKQRIPVVVYKHHYGDNGNVIARCSQPLVGLNLQNRSLQDEKLIAEIFRTQSRERNKAPAEDIAFLEQPQKNLIVDLRPLTNAMAQHALGAGTEIVDNYRGKISSEKDGKTIYTDSQNVDRIFCNIDNIHVMRDSLTKLSNILSDLDRFAVGGNSTAELIYPLLQQSLTKTQWLHRLSLILQAVDRIAKSVHLNNTNVLIHCSDGWDRTSQVSALTQLCLDPYFRTMEGFMVLIEKEWLSFGFKFSTRSDHGGCIGAVLPNPPKEPKSDPALADSELPSGPDSASSSVQNLSMALDNSNPAMAFFHRAAHHIKATASAAKAGAAKASAVAKDTATPSSLQAHFNTYSGSNERSPIFHQFLDCTYQIMRQNPRKFEFNSRFLKRLFYHLYSCQYGTFLCDSEKQLLQDEKMAEHTVSVWDYFLSRRAEFSNREFDHSEGDDVIFPNFTDIKWWFELYGRSDEEMNGLSNSLDRKFAQLKLAKQESLLSPVSGAELPVLSKPVNN